MIIKQAPMPRGAGVLLPVTSIPSPYGIGAFGSTAYDFVDFLSAAGQKYWQVLPLGPTSYGDSPYQSFSAFAGNPYFIDPDLLIIQGLLQAEEARQPNWGNNPQYVDYAGIYRHRYDILKLCYARSKHKGSPQYAAFCETNRFWLEDYCLYMALKMHFGAVEWLRWPEEIRLRQPQAVQYYADLLKEQTSFWQFCQFLFHLQWTRLKNYANRKGIEIIGDIPIYVALDSADVWCNSGLFQLDELHRPTRVAGVPPDMFSATGQLWGNPLYDWQAMEADGFAWWKQRMTASATLYDVIRIDHFVGIAHYFSIPAGDATAENGVWIDGPQEKLLEAISSVMGDCRIIAEDLGIITPVVGRLLEATGYPGMKLMQFGFDGDGTNPNLPAAFHHNQVVFGGTHDNETLAGYFASQDRKTLCFAREYLNVSSNREIPWALIRAGYASCANTAIFQLQDYMGLGNSARINTPSTIGNNWRWRLTEGQLTPALAGKMRRLAALYGR